MTRSGPHDDLTDVAGVRVGHFDRRGGGWRTGTTVVLLPEGTLGGVDVRGGGPCTRETDALAPGTLVDRLHAVCLSGGSVFGLAAASGVADWLAQRGVGLRLGPGAAEVAPIVAGACLYDLRPGAWDRRPDAGFGAAAAEAAAGPRGSGPMALGSVGAGAGARAGQLAGGVGSASAVLDAGGDPAGGPGLVAEVAEVTVAALAAVNSAGSPVDPATGRLYGADLLLEGEEPGLRAPGPEDVAAAGAGRVPSERPARGATVLVVVATDATLTQPECTRVAMAAHDGLSRALRPAHGLTDGDVVFAVSSGTVPLAADVGGAVGPRRAAPGRVDALGQVMAVAADTVTRSVARAVLAASGGAFPPSYLDLYPSARAPR